MNKLKLLYPEKKTSYHLFTREALRILYPDRCPFCNEIVHKDGAKICPDCLSVVREFYEIRGPVCYLCGRELKGENEEYCRECQRHKRSFDGGVSLFRYARMQVAPVPGRKPGFEKHSIGDSILRFKYYNCREYADFYIEELMIRYGGKIRAMNADVIIPVPVHPGRKRYRGYNQAEILAKRLSEYTGLPVCSNLLVRNKKTRPQKGLSDRLRLKNLEQAFSCSGKAPEEFGCALLIDDILTTGSTMEACTRKLKQAGIRQVYCISICSGLQ